MVLLETPLRLYGVFIGIVVGMTMIEDNKIKMTRKPKEKPKENSVVGNGQPFC